MKNRFFPMLLVFGLIPLLCGSAATALPLAPITDQKELDGIPLAQALSTLKELDSHGGPRLLEMMSRPGGECGVGDLDDADICPRYTLFAMEWGETSVPVDFTLFRLPEALGWAVSPNTGRVIWQDNKETMVLDACELKKTAKGWGWQGTSYRLTITESGTWTFTADLTRLPGGRGDCSEYAATKSH